MAYTRDWLESNPVDHTKFSAQPGNVRSHKVDLSDRLKGMFKGFGKLGRTAGGGMGVVPAGGYYAGGTRSAQYNQPRAGR